MDPRAKSNMGRGMMMVTLETAAIVGVKNRLDPEQSINGGSKYIASLLEKNIFGKFKVIVAIFKVTILGQQISSILPKLL